MDPIAWDDTMSIGVQAIDDQHKQLFHLANEVAATLGSGFDRPAVQGALRSLCDYAVEHFAAEEALMDADAYPEYDLHVSAHMECTAKALDFLAAFSADADVDMGEFLEFATGWIHDHILNVDKTLGVFLQGSGKIPAE